MKFSNCQIPPFTQELLPARLEGFTIASGRNRSTIDRRVSLSMLRRVAKVLHARVRVVLEPDDAGKAGALAEDPLPYRVKRSAAKSA